MSAPEAKVVVEAVGLGKVFYDFWHRPKASAVNAVDFTVNQGEVIGLLGPNGSGKSTTVKLILGLLRPTAGSLKVFGHSPAHVATKLRIGYLPEETYLYKYLTAAETLDFFGALFRLTPEQRRRRGEELLRMVGMEAAARRPVGEFSKGMARRIGLAQALINDPDLVILDEPTSGLDPIGCREIKDIIRTLARRGKTVILCSHLLADVQDVCHKVLIMYGGKIRAQGRLDELLNVTDKTRITAPRLEPELVQRILKLIQEGCPGPAPAVDHPTMSLEDFFLAVVNQARAESAATSGVGASGHIADFLAGEDGAKRTAAELLQALAAQPEAPEPPTPPPAAAPEPAPDRARLEQLAKDDAVAAEPPPAPAPAAPEPTPEEKQAKNKAIEDLLKRR